MSERGKRIDQPGSERRPHTERSRDASADKAGSAHGAEPAREQVVIRDKRKIDTSGRPKIPTSGQASREAGDSMTETNAQTTAEQAPPERNAPPEATAAPPATTEAVIAGGASSGSTMGQPGTPSTEDAAGSPTAGARAAGGTVETERPAEDGTATEAIAEPVRAEADKGTHAAVRPGLGAELEALRSDLDERLRDLQRVTAEYANYRKRVERDRGVMAEQAIAMVLLSLLPILDDLDRARDHGDLVGPFGTVAEQLTSALAKFGLTGFGESGDAFDPTRHEAVAHQTSAEVDVPTCVEVMRRGYMVGDRLLRPALVAVADPE